MNGTVGINSTSSQALTLNRFTMMNAGKFITIPCLSTHLCMRTMFPPGSAGYLTNLMNVADASLLSCFLRTLAFNSAHVPGVTTKLTGARSEHDSDYEEPTVARALEYTPGRQSENFVDLSTKSGVAHRSRIPVLAKTIQPETSVHSSGASMKLSARVDETSVNASRRSRIPIIKSKAQVSDNFSDSAPDSALSGNYRIHVCERSSLNPALSKFAAVYDGIAAASRTKNEYPDMHRKCATASSDAKVPPRRPCLRSSKFFASAMDKDTKAVKRVRFACDMRRTSANSSGSKGLPPLPQRPCLKSSKFFASAKVDHKSVRFSHDMPKSRPTSSRSERTRQ